MFMRTRAVEGNTLFYSLFDRHDGCGHRSQASILPPTESQGRHTTMVLIYESDPLDDEDARGRFYHVCRGRIIRTEIQLPEGQSVYECATCGIDLEPEDFWIARQKGSV